MAAVIVFVLLGSLVNALDIDNEGDQDGPHHHHRHHSHKHRQINVRSKNMNQADLGQKPLQLLPKQASTNLHTYFAGETQDQQAKHLEVTHPSNGNQPALPQHVVPEGMVTSERDQEVKHLEVTLPSTVDAELTANPPPADPSIKHLEYNLPEQDASVVMGKILVNGPLPTNFPDKFAHCVGQATGVDPGKVTVIDTTPKEGTTEVEVATFEAPKDVVEAVAQQAIDPSSKLVNGLCQPFFVWEPVPRASAPATPLEESMDIDTAMPYGDMDPFGREDTAQELTEASVKESDQMVDQLERAEVAEEKRAVFRALTRLRGAAITSFDGVARSQTGNIDEYNKVHKWRNSHPLHHLADEESDVAKWAFPDNAEDRKSVV